MNFIGTIMPGLMVSSVPAELATAKMKNENNTTIAASQIPPLKGVA